MNKMKIKFNDVANVLASVSAVGLATIVAVGGYVYVNKDAIIEDIKNQALESVLGGAGVGGFSGAGAGGAAGGLGADTLPLGTNDLKSTGPQAKTAPDTAEPSVKF